MIAFVDSTADSCIAVYAPLSSNLHLSTTPIDGHGREMMHTSNVRVQCMRMFKPVYKPCTFHCASAGVVMWYAWMAQRVAVLVVQ